MKERFSEKLLTNPSLWSLNALTSQVENISNNVQQLLLSEALVANKKGAKRSSGGSNSSAGSGASSKKGEEYRSPSYPDSGIGGGSMQDPYSTPQHQPIPMEINEGGYSSSSDEQLERGYFYCGQGRSPSQAPNNTHLSLDTVSSCSMTSPDDMSTRSGDSGVHNLTPDPTRCQSGQRGDDMGTPVKSTGDERSPISITIPSPIKQELNSPSDRQQDELLKENFEESAWTEKLADKDEIRTEKSPDHGTDIDTTKSKDSLKKWLDEKYSALHSNVNKEETERSYCYEEYEGVQENFDPDSRELVEQSSASLSVSSHQEHFGQEIKSKTFKSASPTASESSLKTLPFISGGDLEPDQYSIEKEDSSENTSPTPAMEPYDESNADKVESREEEDEDEGDREEDNEADDEDEDDTQKHEQHSLSPPLSAEVGEELGEGEKMSKSTSEEHMNNTDEPETPHESLCIMNESTELHTDRDFVGAPAHLNTAVADASARESAIGDTAPQPQSAMPIFSALNDKAAPPAPARDHIDHSDAKVLEPDSPQLPGKSILPSAPSWADTPPSPQKGDEDVEPGISGASAVTPLAKSESVAPSAQPRAFGRKHARGRRRIMHSSVGIRRQPSLETDVEKEKEGAPSPAQKATMPPSKTVLISDQMDLAHQESLVSQTPKMISDGIGSRMCTRSFNAPDLLSKAEPNIKRKPGPKPGSKIESRPGAKLAAKPGPKPGPKPGLKPKVCLKPGPKPGPRLVPKEEELPVKFEAAGKRKPGPKPETKTEQKTALKRGPKPKPKPEPDATQDLPTIDPVVCKAPVGRPKGSVSKTKQLEVEETTQHIIRSQSRSRRTLKVTISQENKDENAANGEEKEKETKNMVLRSRKTSQEKLLKEKEKNKGEDIATPPQTEMNRTDVSPKVEESLTVEQSCTSALTTIENIDIPSDLPASLASPDPTEQSEDTTSLPLKRKSTPEVIHPPIKKKRGPKPKPKPSTLQAQEVQQLEENVPGTKEQAVRASGRKRGPPRRTSVDSTLTKDTTNSSETDITSDLPLVPPQCPTKTKVLPPRKGRGQKYEAMVQKITSPSSKKHIPLIQMDNNVSDDITAKVLSHTETSVAEEVHVVEVKQEEIKLQEKVVTKEDAEINEVKEATSASEEVRQAVEEQVLNQDYTMDHKPDRQQNVAADQVPSLMAVPVEVSSPETLTSHSSEGGSLSINKSSRIKRKRWAMVESTDASVVALEAGSLIVTTPRLAKQKAIKNNHEMHLKQKRKKRKGQDPHEEAEPAEELEQNEEETRTQTSPEPKGSAEEYITETTEQTEVEEKIGPMDSVLPISPDKITEILNNPSPEDHQKPRRGRKPSANPTKRKKIKVEPEQNPDAPVKIYKKPGPKPGMKDALEVIEAVVRAAGCEQAEKEEREKAEREQREGESEEKHSTCYVGPTVLVSETQTETIAVKRIRRRPVHCSKMSFLPYVRLNNSRDFSSWCAVVNKPEDAVIFQRRRKKGILRMKNPFTVAKVAPHTAAMLQGPLVNKGLTRSSLSCSLCGHPANYRDLGDLCGPYYTEGSLPRKILTVTHTDSHRKVSENGSEGSCGNSEKTEVPMKSEGECVAEQQSKTETISQEGSSGRNHHWHYRRAARTERKGQEGGTHRLTLRERFKRMKHLQASTSGALGDQEGGDSTFQRLQAEAEAQEHWAHENCAVWTKGVIMVAGRLYGLKEASNNAAQTVKITEKPASI